MKKSRKAHKQNSRKYFKRVQNTKFNENSKHGNAKNRTRNGARDRTGRVRPSAVSRVLLPYFAVLAMRAHTAVVENMVTWKRRRSDPFFAQGNWKNI